MAHVRFQDRGAFAESGPWRFLPFRFHRLTTDKVLLTNQGGEFIILTNNNFNAFTSLDLAEQANLYFDLKSKGFLSHGPDDTELRVLASQLRTKKSFLESGPRLHIFVPTLRCNQVCGYCQVSRACVDRTGVDMSRETASKAIDLMLSAPAQNLTMEFQGGEALLAFDMVTWMVETTDDRAQKLGKNVRYVICTNITLLTDVHLDLFKRFNVNVSTSLDGPAFIHDKNRPLAGASAYSLVIENIKKCDEFLGKGNTSCLMTTTLSSLPHAKLIIDEYLALGQSSIFLRELNPYGYAAKAERAIGYDTQAFLTFYKEALAYIIEINRKGIHFAEGYAGILLRKILTSGGVGFVDLQSPTGEGFGVVLYNHDGSVYASDEARMLGEMGDFSFRLGTVDNSFSELMLSDTQQCIAAAGVAESLVGCSDCAFVPFCGADPIRNYRTQSDLFGHRPTSSFCKKNMGVFQHLFSLLDSGDTELQRILMSWVQPSHRDLPRVPWQR